MPAAGGVTFDTGHADMIHDTQLDYYGRVRGTLLALVALTPSLALDTL